MRTPCEVIVKLMLPAFRSSVAKALTDQYHLSQMEVAQLLGTTQAAVSQYVSSKRGARKSKGFEEVPRIDELADEVARGIALGTLSSADAMLSFCKMCKAFRTQDVACTLHKDLVQLPNGCDICPSVLSK